MVAFKFVITKQARKEIKKLDKTIAQRLAKKLIVLQGSSQPLRTATRLTKPADADYRLRLGDYRILFDVNSKTKLITILKVQHRSEVYKSFRRAE